jgi:hypothetical protein
MWKKAVLLTVFFILAVSMAHGQEGGRLGMGLVMGNPTGIAWKYRMDQVNAVDGSIGFSPYDRFRFNVDYLWHSRPFKEQNLAIHYGPGVAFGVANSASAPFPGSGSGNAGFGVRGLVGLTYAINNSPVDIFFELAPLVVLVPGPASGIDLGFGLRAYP